MNDPRPIAPLRPLPAEPERYIDREELAELMGVHPATVDRMRKDQGLPSHTWGRRTRRFLLSEVRAWERDQNRRAA